MGFGVNDKWGRLVLSKKFGKNLKSQKYLIDQ